MKPELQFLTVLPVSKLVTRSCDTSWKKLEPSKAISPAPKLTPIVGQNRYAISRHVRRRQRERERSFADAVHLAFLSDWPITVGLTVSWSALKSAGERKEGHCLGMGEWEREAYFRSELARLCRSACIPFVALWGRDIGKRLATHLHLGMFWPTREIPRLVGLVERVSGSSAEFVRIAYEQDTASRSVCGGWQIDVNNRNDAEASALEWAGYVAGQPCKHPAPPMLRGKAFGLSQAIGRSAQEAARAQLDERRERTALRLQNGS